MQFKTGFFLLFVLMFALHAFSQADSLNTTKDTVVRKNKVAKVYKDSALVAKEKFTKDSITWFYLKPDPKRVNLFVEEMLTKYLVTDPTLISIKSSDILKKEEYKIGNPVRRFPAWVLGVIGIIIISFAVMKLVFTKQLSLVFHAFYDNRILAQINKEENVFTSWHFLFSYIIFSFTIGLFLYLFLDRYETTLEVSGFFLFLMISLAFGFLYGLKILVLRFVGFVFEIQKPIRDYINIIYLSFFNVSVFFIPLTLILILTVYKESNLILLIGVVITLTVIILQLLRAWVQILSNYKLSKFYLILYLCTLEICPILILFKALNI
jgi:hypothetical protein